MVVTSEAGVSTVPVDSAFPPNGEVVKSRMSTNYALVLAFASTDSFFPQASFPTMFNFDINVIFDNRKSRLLVHAVLAPLATEIDFSRQIVW